MLMDRVVFVVIELGGQQRVELLGTEEMSRPAGARVAGSSLEEPTVPHSSSSAVRSEGVTEPDLTA